MTEKKYIYIYININIFEIYFFIYFFILFIYFFIYLFLLLFSGTQLRICVQVATPLNYQMRKGGSGEGPEIAEGRKAGRGSKAKLSPPAPSPR